jgi:hypothetical protein
MAAVKLKPEDFLNSQHHGFILEQTASYLIIDNFLSPEQFAQVWSYFQIETYMRVDSQGYEGKWRLEDGAAMRGPTIGYGEKWHGQFPTGSALDLVIQSILNHHSLFADLIGEMGKDWQNFTAFPSLYPSHTGLLWHRDSTDNAGSYSYYGHPEWNIEWGGELLLADLGKKKIPDHWGTFMKEPKPVVGGPPQGVTWSSHLDNRDANQSLLERGTGFYIYPKPNRLVLIKGGTPHAVNKVKSSAGDHVRASVSGFFKKKL